MEESLQSLHLGRGNPPFDKPKKPTRLVALIPYNLVPLFFFVGKDLLLRKAIF